MNAISASPGPHPEASDAGSLAVALQALLLAAEDARRAMAERMDLSENEVWAMQHVMGEPLGPVELGRRLHISSASATVLVDRLEQAGHVRRVPHGQDRRRRLVVPTQHGVASVFQQIGPMLQGLTDAESTLTDTEVELVGSYLTRVTRVLAEVARGQQATS
jgi:DNA-binding MarR family transcriptional regulator